LIRQPPHEEVASVAHHRGAHAVRLQQFLESLADGRPAWQGVEHRARVRVLRINPGARFRTLLVLEPSVGVADGDTVNGFAGIAGARRGNRGGEWRRKSSPYGKEKDFCSKHTL